MPTVQVLRSTACWASLFLVALPLRAQEARHPYSLPYLATPYHEEGFVAVEIAYAVPRAGITVSGGRRDAVRLEQRVSVTDQAGWVRRSSRARYARLAPAAGQGIPENYLIVRDRLRVTATPCRVHLEVVDLNVGSVGEFDAEIVDPGLGDTLAVSSLCLASRIDVGRTPPLRRSDLEIETNPLRIYKPETPVFVYFELYHLVRDTFGQTSFEIGYQVGRPEPHELRASLFEAVREADPSKAEQEEGVAYLVPPQHRKGVRVGREWGGPNHEATTSTAYVGDATSDFTFLQLDVSRLPEGAHKLTVRVRDLNAGRTAERSELFRIVR